MSGLRRGRRCAPGRARRRGRLRRPPGPVVGRRVPRRRRHRRHRLPHGFELLRHRRQPDVGVVRLLAQDPHAFGDVVDQQLLIGERLAVGAGLIVEFGRDHLQRVGEPAEHLLELLLLFLQHADLRHQLLVRLVGRAGEPRHRERQAMLPQPSMISCFASSFKKTDSHAAVVTGLLIEPGFNLANPDLKPTCVTTKCARRFFDHDPSSWPGSNGNSLP